MKSISPHNVGDSEFSTKIFSLSSSHCIPVYIVYTWQFALVYEITAHTSNRKDCTAEAVPLKKGSRKKKKKKVLYTEQEDDLQIFILIK